MSQSSLVLFAHGSKDPRWREPFEKLTADLRADLGDTMIWLAYMDFAQPTLQDVADELKMKGITRIRLLPLFLAGGAHVAKDIPEQVSQVQARIPGFEVEVLPPVGENPRFAGLLREIARESI